MVKECPRCGLRFERDEGSRLGSAMVNYAVVGMALVAYLVVAFIATLPDPPVGTLVIGAVVVVVGVALVFFPFAKTLWAAIELVLRGADPEN
jgi:Na+/phosphate symporter